MSGVHGGLKESMKLPGNKKSKTYKVSQKIHNANLKTKQKKKKSASFITDAKQIQDLKISPVKRPQLCQQ